MEIRSTWKVWWYNNDINNNEAYIHATPKNYYKILLVLFFFFFFFFFLLLLLLLLLFLLLLLLLLLIQAPSQGGSHSNVLLVPLRSLQLVAVAQHFTFFRCHAESYTPPVKHVGRTMHMVEERCSLLMLSATQKQLQLPSEIIPIKEYLQASNKDVSELTTIAQESVRIRAK